jgi:hypothetical protein
MQDFETTANRLMRRAPPARPSRAGRTSSGGRAALTVLLQCCLVACLALSPSAGAENSAAGVSLNRLAMSLVEAPGPLRTDLAYAAISELAAAYAREADRAQRDKRYRAGDRDLRRWATAVEQMASELALLAETVTFATSVDIGVSPGNRLYLIVDGRPVLVDGPRPREQRDLEQRVIERFCSLNLCDQLLAEFATLASTQGPPAAPPMWRFSQQAGPVCATDDGLEFQFQDTQHLSEKREACAQVVAELNLLAAEIGRQLDLGVRVDWNTLSIRRLPGQFPHRVMLSADGESLQLSVPALAAMPDIFALVRPWLAARVTGSRYRLVVINAERLLAPLGLSSQ